MEANTSMKRYADYLDTKFKLPGTNIRFGFDFLIGLVPGFGDVVSFLLSSGLILAMIKKGASGKALSLMIVNVILDTTLGSIPLIGDVFDLFFKANKRNLDLYQDHFQEGKYEGSAWKVIIPILLILILILVGIGYLIYLILSLIYYLLI
jgi:hypothetical protein